MGMDQLESFVLHSPEAFYRTLSLACCILLRISRSLLRERVDLATGETAYFTAINLFKRRSIQNNDLNSRSAAIMTQLWQSQWVFKKADGTVDSLHVRVCNRGVSLTSLFLFFPFSPLSGWVVRLLILLHSQWVLCTTVFGMSARNLTGSRIPTQKLRDRLRCIRTQASTLWIRFSIVRKLILPSVPWRMVNSHS